LKVCLLQSEIPGYSCSASFPFWVLIRQGPVVYITQVLPVYHINFPKSKILWLSSYLGP
jgi:hypothetical protein